MRAALMSLALAAVLAVACRTEKSPPALTIDDIIGEWRTAVTTPLGEIPGRLVLERTDAGPRASFHNLDHVTPVDLTIEGQSLTLVHQFYEGEIRATVSANRKQMTGSWWKYGKKLREFSASRKLEPLFGAAPADITSSIPGTGPLQDTVAGSWSGVMPHHTGPLRFEGTLEQTGQRVHGTFMTPIGDTQTLVGVMQGGIVRLAHFDGGYGYLFHGKVFANGKIKGFAWTTSTHSGCHVASKCELYGNWEGHLTKDGEALPDPTRTVTVTATKPLPFEFPRVDGKGLMGLSHKSLANKVVLVDIFGSWCKTCLEQAPYLRAWYERYHDRGLEIIGVACEFTGDAERDRKKIAKYVRKHDLPYPVVVAPTEPDDVADTTRFLKGLSHVTAFPTSVFIGRDGKIRYTHSGFAGPSMGKTHTDMLARYERMLEELLAEKIPE